MPVHVEVSPPETDSNVIPPMVSVVSPPPPTPGTAVSTRPAGGSTPSAAAPNEVMVAIASLIIPGLGQLLVGQALKGILLFVVCMATAGLCGIVNIFAAIDAYFIAQRLARGETVSDFQVF